MTREEIAEYNEEALLLDGFDEAIIGIAERINLGPVVAYDVEKIIEILMKDMEVSEDELDEGESIESRKYQMALEYFDYNVKGAWMGEFTPIFITTSQYDEIIERERERIPLDDDFEDQTGYGPWEYKEQVYNKVTEVPNTHCDGEGTDVIVQRVSDNKYFKFTWILTRSENYHMDDEMVEVYPKLITTTIYE